MKDKIYLCLAFVLFYGCTNNNANLKIQKIESPLDCESCVRWSWNNGLAKTSGHYYDSDATFEFISKLSGNLAFKYALWTENQTLIPYLEVSINDVYCFDEGKTSDDTLSVVLKNIPNRAKVIFKGHHCVVKDIMITSIDYVDSGDDPDKHHDF